MILSLLAPPIAILAIGSPASTTLLEGGLHTPAGFEVGARGAPLPKVHIQTSDGASFEALIDEHALVQLAEGASERIFDELGVIPERLLSARLRIWSVRDVGGADGAVIAARLAADPRASAALALVTPDYHLWHRPASPNIPPNDPRYPGQWYLERIAIEEAWALETGSAETTVVVIDNGCDPAHPDLVDKLDPGRDVVDRDDDPSHVPGQPGNNHGTACAGVVGATTDNGEGIAGTCPGCRLRCVRLLPGRGAFVPLSADIEAFEFARSVGAAVISNSWSLGDGIPAPTMLTRVITSVMNEGRDGLGTVVVFAVGNDNREVGPRELASLENVVGVGATTLFDEATSFSNRGQAVDLVAPAGTLTTDISGPDGDSPGDYTTSFGGTSSACPVVAGVAGLLASANPGAHAREIEAALLATTRRAPFAQPDDIGWDPVYGFGIVAPGPALAHLLGVPLPTDGGLSDGGAADGGVAADAGASADAGEPIVEEEGCGCTGGGQPRGVLGGLFLVLLAGGMRRSRR